MLYLLADNLTGHCNTVTLSLSLSHTHTHTPAAKSCDFCNMSSLYSWLWQIYAVTSRNSLMSIVIDYELN
jgi:hypothetical protein